MFSLSLPRFLLVILVALLLACGEQANHSSVAERAIAEQNAGKLSAAGAVNAYADALRRNDIRSLVELALPKAQLETMRTNFAQLRDATIDDDDRKRFTESFMPLLAPDAVDKIMAQLEPKLVEIKPQLTALVSMGTGVVQLKISESSLTDAEKAAANKAVSSLQAWATKVDLADPKRARKAVSALVQAAKALELSTPEEVSALSYEQLLDKFGICFAGFKTALMAYELDLDAVLASVQAKDLDAPGKVEIKLEFLGEDYQLSSVLTQRDGRWSN